MGPVEGEIGCIEQRAEPMKAMGNRQHLSPCHNSIETRRPAP